MRRPSPLPPPPAGAAAQMGAPRTGEVDAPAVDETAPPIGEAAGPPASSEGATADAPPLSAADADQPTAPIIPITSPTPLQRPAALDTALGDRPADEIPEAEVAPEVGVRAVWRAARARRRALRAEVRRFTVRQRRRRALWLGVAASLVVLVLATLGAAYSPLFAVETITVQTSVLDGTTQLDVAAVEAALADELGTPLPLVDESAVKAALITFPLVESYSLEARPPHELVVRIVERMPIGLIETPAGYSLVDAAGVVLSTSSSPPSGIPLLSIQGGTGSAAFDAVGQVMRSLPEPIRLQVTAVAASTPDDVMLTLGGPNAQVFWGSADESALKAVVLQTTMAARPPETVSLYDVSSPRAVVIG